MAGDTGRVDPARSHASVLAAGLDARGPRDFLCLGLLRQRWGVHVVPVLVDAGLFRYSLEKLGGMPAIRLEAGQMAPAEAVLKRGLDVIGALAGLVALAPFLGAIAAAIKFTSPGPVLFSQPRVGKSEDERFRMYKFRSMRTDA